MLVNVPLRNQLNEPTADNGPDEAARANCVPASLGAAVSALTGQTIYGDALRDLVYPESYTGATNPADYIPVLKAKFGIEMVEFDSADGAALVQRVIAALEAHEPVSAAIPSEWAYLPQPDAVHCQGGTHEVCFCDYDAAAGTLTAMNPWPEPPTNDAFYQTQLLDWWAERLVYGRVFVLSGGHAMSISIGDVAGYFTQADPQHWVSVKGGYAVQMGILAAYQSWPSAGTLAGLTALGLPLSGPVYLDQTKYPGVCEQTFERGCLRYDPNRLADNPPGASGPVYLAHYPAATAPDPAGQAALAEVAAIKKVLGVVV